MCVLVAQSFLTLCNPIECNSPGSPVHGILQARILEWVVISSSRVLSYKCSLFILNTRSLLDIWFENIFSHCVGCLLLSDCVFWGMKSFQFWWSPIYFSLVVDAIGVISKEWSPNSRLSRFIPMLSPKHLLSLAFAFRDFFFFCSEFCHTLKWNSHGFTCVPHPDPPSHLPLHLIPLGLPSAPGPSACLVHPTWAGDLFHPR